MDDKMKQQGQQLNIEIPADVAGGVYANMAIIGHSPAEFIMDFVAIMPSGRVPQAKVRSRVIMTPQHIKQLSRALQENVSKYESMHGAIKEISDPMMRGPMAQA